METILNIIILVFALATVWAVVNLIRAGYYKIYNKQSHYLGFLILYFLSFGLLLLSLKNFGLILLP